MPKDNTAYGPSSNPSSRSYGGGGGGGGVSTGKTSGNTSSSLGAGSPLAGLANARPTTGITTGNTIYGNTAYGPSGGMAQGYATRSGGISGMGPSVGTYSNFRNLDGSAAIPGAGNMPAMGRNAFQARSQLQRNFGAPPRVGGLLSGEEVSVAPIPTRQIVPMAGPAPIGALQKYLQAAFPGGLGANWLNNARSMWSSLHMNNPTQRPYDASQALSWGSTFPKNNMGDFGGLGNRSTQYKNAPGSTFGKNNMGQ